MFYLKLVCLNAFIYLFIILFTTLYVWLQFICFEVQPRSIWLGLIDSHLRFDPLMERQCALTMDVTLINFNYKMWSDEVCKFVSANVLNELKFLATTKKYTSARSRHTISWVKLNRIGMDEFIGHSGSRSPLDQTHGQSIQCSELVEHPCASYESRCIGSNLIGRSDQVLTLIITCLKPWTRLVLHDRS